MKELLWGTHSLLSDPEAPTSPAWPVLSLGGSVAGHPAPRMETELCPVQGAPNQATFLRSPRLVHNCRAAPWETPAPDRCAPTQPTGCTPQELPSSTFCSVTPGTKLRLGTSSLPAHTRQGLVRGGSDESLEGCCPRSPDGPANHSPPPRDFATLSYLGQPPRTEHWVCIQQGASSQPPGQMPLLPGEDVGSLPFPVGTLLRF